MDTNFESFEKINEILLHEKLIKRKESKRTEVAFSGLSIRPKSLDIDEM